MKKIVIALLIATLAVFAVFVLKDHLPSDTVVSTTPPAEITFEDITVLIRQDQPIDGIYTDFTLHVGNTEIPFQGKLLAHKDPPQIYYTDLTSDNHNDIIVVFQSDAGTGVYGEDIHIFDGVTLEEYSIEFLPGSINAYAETSTENGLHTITISEKEYTVNTDELVGYDPSDAGDFYISKEYYRYRISDQTLSIQISCGIGRYGTCGDVEVTFELKGPSFVFDSSVFIQYDGPLMK